MKTVKKSFMIVATFLLLAVFFAFSSGVVITIHHCCHHCQELAEKSACCNDGNCACCSDDNGDGVNTGDDSHDTQYYFKILDDYIKTDIAIAASWDYFQTDVVCMQSEFFTSSFYKTLIKENLKIPPFFHLQGVALLDFCQQRVYYA